MLRRVIPLLALACLLALAARAQEEPAWSFQGVLPMIFEVYDQVPLRLYTEEGHVLSDEEISAALDLRVGDPVVLIRDRAVVGSARLAAVVAAKHGEAQNKRVLYVRLEGLPEGISLPDPPEGYEPMASGEYDLLVFTDKPVEVLAVDPLFEDIAWGQQDFVVRVGHTRYAVIRENDPRQSGFRGWQVSRIAGTKSARMMADYTWWQR